MSEPLLTEEAGDRAACRLQSLLTLVSLAFDAAEANARTFAIAEPDRIIDPVASACFAEARELLLRPAVDAEQLRAGLFTALFGLDAASSREPELYRTTHQLVRSLVLEALDEVVELELAAAEAGSALVSVFVLGRICN